MCETVLEFFKSMHVARDIRDGASYWNRVTHEYAFRDEGFDTEDAWRDRGVWDVCCLTRLVPCGGGGMFGDWDYSSSNDRDVSITEVALRIATEDGWARA